MASEAGVSDAWTCYSLKLNSSLCGMNTYVGIICCVQWTGWTDQVCWNL